MVQKMKNNNPIIQNIFLFSLFLAQIRAFCTKIIFIAPIVPVLEKILFITLAILSVYIFFSAKFKAKEIILVVALLFLAFVSYVITDSLTLSFLLMLPFASKGIENKKIIKADLVSKIITTSVIIACYYMNLTENRLFYRDGILRESFGFAHPNTLGYMAIMISIDALYMTRIKTSSVLCRVLVTLVPLYLCSLADSRTAMFAIIAVLIFSVIEAIGKKLKKEPKNKQRKAISRLIYLAPIMLILFSFASTKAYANHENWAICLDEALSSRISLQDYYEKHYEVSLLGHEITSDEFEDKPLDNGYYRILFNNGVLGLIALVVIIELSLKKSTKTNDYNTFVLILLLVYGLSEWTVFRVIITPHWTIAFAKEDEK